MTEHGFLIIGGGPAGFAAAHEILGWLQADGVQIASARAVERIERNGTVLTVIAGETRASGGVVVMASGVSPHAELAAAGAELRDGAVPVDAAMRTAAPDLLAACDVCLAENTAAGRALRVEHWREALAHGRIAGRTAAHVDATSDAVPGFRSSIGTRTLTYAAWGDGFDDSRTESRPDGVFVVTYGRERKLVGILAYKVDDDDEQGSDAIKRGVAWTG